MGVFSGVGYRIRSKTRSKTRSNNVADVAKYQPRFILDDAWDFVFTLECI